MELARLERQITKLEEREGRLHAALDEQATDYTTVVKLDAELPVLRPHDALPSAMHHPELPMITHRNQLAITPSPTRQHAPG